MTFSERKKLEKEYYNWLDKNKNVKPCPFSLISFLDGNGNLFDNTESNKIKVLEKALELACVDILSEKYPKIDFTNYKPRGTMKSYKNRAYKVLEVQNEREQREGII